jgi:hypothetical protein
LLDRRSLYGVRDREIIDAELRLSATTVRWSICEHGGEPSSRQAGMPTN